jgi:hypothetical protein
MRPLDSLVNIGILKDDIRTLPTQFQGNLLQPRRPHDFLAHGGGSSEGNLVDTRVSHQGRTGRFSEAREDVHDAGRKPRSFDEGAEDESREGSLFGGFEDDGVSAGQGGCDFPGCSNTSECYEGGKFLGGGVQNMARGKFQGMIWPQTPRGSCIVYYRQIVR